MLEATKNPTPTGYTSPDGTKHAVAEFILTGITAALVEQAEHAHFYGIHADGQTAANARRELSNEISGYLDAHFPGYTAFNILRAKPEDTDGEPTPYRARIVVEIDYLTDVTTEAGVKY